MKDTGVRQNDSDVYAYCEALYRARLHPWAAVGDLAEADRAAPATGGSAINSHALRYILCAETLTGETLTMEEC